MARLSDGCITLAGLGWCLSGSSTANLHPAVTVDPFSPRPWLTGHDPCFSTRPARVLILQNSLTRIHPWTAAAVPYIPSMSAGSDTTCLQPGQTLMTGDLVSDTTGSSGSSVLALLCPDKCHSMMSSRTSFRALASLPFLSHVHM